MKTTILTPAAVRAAIARLKGDQTMPQLAQSLGMGKSQLYEFLKHGVEVELSKAQRRMLEAAGVEIVVKKKGKS